MMFKKKHILSSVLFLSLIAGCSDAPPKILSLDSSGHAQTQSATTSLISGACTGAINDYGTRVAGSGLYLVKTNINTVSDGALKPFSSVVVPTNKNISTVTLLSFTNSGSAPECSGIAMSTRILDMDDGRYLDYALETVAVDGFLSAKSVTYLYQGRAIIPSGMDEINERITFKINDVAYVADLSTEEGPELRRQRIKEQFDNVQNNPSFGYKAMPGERTDKKLEDLMIIKNVSTQRMPIAASAEPTQEAVTPRIQSVRPNIEPTPETTIPRTQNIRTPRLVMPVATETNDIRN